MNMNLKITQSTASPLYMQIKEQLKAYIKNKQLPPNTKLPNVKIIASNAGVSIRTADLALKELAREGVCFRRPKKGAFVADKDRNNYKKTIFGYIFGHNEKDIADDLVSSSIYRGLMSKAVKYNIDPISFSIDNIEENIEFYSKSEGLCLGGLVIAASLDMEIITKLAKKYPDLTFILLNYFMPNFLLTPDNMIGVFNDDVGGGYQLMDLMLKNGRKNFGIISLSDNNDNYENRIKGFQMALRNSSLKTKTLMQICNPTGDEICQQREAQDACEELFRSKPEIDAIMCVNDELAKGTLKYLRDKGIGDVAVCGYDNLIPQKNGEDSFITMEIDFEEIGKTAVDIIANSKKEYVKVIKVPPVLIRK